MDTNKLFLRGGERNPFHLSVGQVCLKDNHTALIHKPTGIFTLPRETAWLDESYLDTLIRGAQEELGAKIRALRFLGTQMTEFNRKPEVVIEKTTLYFLTEHTGDTEKSLMGDELNDKVIWEPTPNAIEKLSNQNNPEAEIIKRVLNQ